MRATHLNDPRKIVEFLCRNRSFARNLLSRIGSSKSIFSSSTSRNSLITPQLIQSMGHGQNGNSNKDRIFLGINFTFSLYSYQDITDRIFVLQKNALEDGSYFLSKILNLLLRYRSEGISSLENMFLRSICFRYIKTFILSFFHSSSFPSYDLSLSQRQKFLSLFYLQHDLATLQKDLLKIFYLKNSSSFFSQDLNNQFLASSY